MQVVVHYSEIGLKGRNRPKFEERLRRNLERALAPLGARVSRLYGRLLVELDGGADWGEAESRLRRVFGVAFFGRATVCAPELEAIERAVDGLVDATSFETFGVRARRVDKQNPLSSLELNERIGRHVLQRTGKRVDLGAPDLWIEVHLLARRAR